MILECEPLGLPNILEMRRVNLKLYSPGSGVQELALAIFEKCISLKVKFDKLMHSSFKVEE